MVVSTAIAMDRSRRSPSAAHESHPRCAPGVGSRPYFNTGPPGEISTCHSGGFTEEVNGFSLTRSLECRQGSPGACKLLSWRRQHGTDAGTHGTATEGRATNQEPTNQAETKSRQAVAASQARKHVPGGMAN